MSADKTYIADEDIYEGDRVVIDGVHVRRLDRAEKRKQGVPTPMPGQIELVSHIASLFGNRPAEPRHMNAIIKAANDILAEFKREHVPAREGMGLAAWLASDDTGMSSKYLAMLLHAPAASVEFAYPRDPADFGRCYRMLRAVPTDVTWFKARCSAAMRPWPQLADKWEELEKLYEEELGSGRAPKLCAAMQQLYKDIGLYK